MADIIKASAQAIKTFAGPIAFPIDFILSLYDDEQAKEREERIINLIKDGHSLTREVLDDIIEIKNDMKAMRNQLINGMWQCDSPIKSNLHLINRHEIFETSLTQWLRIHGRGFHESGLLTQEDLVNELMTAYKNDPEHFDGVIEPLGFPCYMLKTFRSIKRQFVHFTEICGSKRLQPHNVARIFRGIAEDCQNANDIFNLCSEIWEEIVKSSR